MPLVIASDRWSSVAPEAARIETKPTKQSLIMEDYFFRNNIVYSQEKAWRKVLRQAPRQSERQEFITS